MYQPEEREKMYMNIFSDKKQADKATSEFIYYA
jgi:hypothetical protein